MFLSCVAYFLCLIIGVFSWRTLSLYHRNIKQTIGSKTKSGSLNKVIKTNDSQTLFITQQTICDVLENKRDTLNEAIKTNDPSILTPKYDTAFEAAMAIPLYFNKKIKEYSDLAAEAKQKDEEVLWKKYTRYSNVLKTLSYSLHKGTKHQPLSVTMGFAKYLFDHSPEMKTVCIADGGTGYTRMYLYENNKGTVSILGGIENYSAPSFSSLDIPKDKGGSNYEIPTDKDGKSLFPKKSMDEFIADFTKEVLEKIPESWRLARMTNPANDNQTPCYVMITGPLRTHWENSSIEARNHIDNYINDRFCTQSIHGFRFKPWNSIMPNTKSLSCIISQRDEALMEYNSVKTRIQSIAAERKCAGSLGIGCGSCQGCLSIIDQEGNTVTKVFEFGHGMKETQKLEGFADWFEKLFETDPVLMDGFINFLEKNPGSVFGFLAGALLQVNANVMKCFNK